MAKDLHVNSRGLVACEILVSSAANGMRQGEIRGFSPDKAEALAAKKYVRPLSKEEVEGAAKAKAKAKAE